jgi:hypothetical protein
VELVLSELLDRDLLRLRPRLLVVVRVVDEPVAPASQLDDEALGLRPQPAHVLARRRGLGAQVAEVQLDRQPPLVGERQLRRVRPVDRRHDRPPEEHAPGGEDDQRRRSGSAAQQPAEDPARRRRDQRHRQRDDQDQPRERVGAVGEERRDAHGHRQQDHPGRPGGEPHAEVRRDQDGGDDPRLVVAVLERVVDAGERRADEHGVGEEGERQCPPRGHGAAQMT